MIYAGVDIAKTDHVIGAVDERGAEACRPMPFKNTEAGFERAVAWLKPHRVAVTAVARKLCHIVFAVMRDQVPYDSERK